MEYRVHIYRSQRDQEQFTYGDITSVREDGTGRTANLMERVTGRLGEILAAAQEGDQLDRFFSVPAESWRREFDRGWEQGLTDFLNELRAGEQTDGIGRAVWEAWHSGMVTQGRIVLPYQQDWDTLPPEDQQLYRAIGTIVIQRLAIVCAENARANRSMRDNMSDPVWLSEIEHMRVPVAPKKVYQPIHVEQMDDPIMIVPTGETEGKPATKDRASVEIAKDARIAEQEALLATLRAKTQRQRERSSARFRRMDAERDKLDHRLNGQIEILEAQIAYHKERSVNVTARLEVAKEALIEIGRLKINDGIREYAEREVSDLGWHAKYEDAAATLEKVIAERDTQARKIATLKEETANLDRAHRDSISERTALMNDANKRMAEIDKLRDELTRLRLGGTPPPAFVTQADKYDPMRHSAPLPSGMPTRMPTREAVEVWTMGETDNGHYTIYRDTFANGEYETAQAEPTRIMPETAEAIRRIMGKPALLNDLFLIEPGSDFRLGLTPYRIEVGQEIGQLATPGILPNVAREDTEGTTDGSERTDLAGLPLFLADE